MFSHLSTGSESSDFSAPTRRANRSSFLASFRIAFIVSSEATAMAREALRLLRDRWALEEKVLGAEIKPLSEQYHLDAEGGQRSIAARSLGDRINRLVDLWAEAGTNQGLLERALRPVGDTGGGPYE